MLMLVPSPARCMGAPPLAYCAAAAARARPLAMTDDSVDTVVLYGDAAALVGYGAIQAVVDFLLSPLAEADPDLFTNSLPLEAPVAQGSLVALR